MQCRWICIFPFFSLVCGVPLLGSAATDTPLELERKLIELAKYTCANEIKEGVDYKVTALADGNIEFMLLGKKGGGIEGAFIFRKEEWKGQQKVLIEDRAKLETEYKNCVVMQTDKLRETLVSNVARTADQANMDLGELRRIAITIESEINQVFSDVLSQEDSLVRSVCVPARWESIKIPEFKGFKVYMKEIKTKISPDIACDVKTVTTKSGAAKVTVNPETMLFEIMLPTQTNVEVTGLGAIGKYIKASSELDAVTNISIGVLKQENQHSVSIQKITHDWPASSHITLLGTIDVNAETTAIPALEYVSEYIEKKIQSELK